MHPSEMWLLFPWLWMMEVDVDNSWRSIPLLLVIPHHSPPRSLHSQQQFIIWACHMKKTQHSIAPRHVCRRRRRGVATYARTDVTDTKPTQTAGPMSRPSPKRQTCAFGAQNSSCHSSTRPLARERHPARCGTVCPAILLSSSQVQVITYSTNSGPGLRVT